MKYANLYAEISRKRYNYITLGEELGLKPQTVGFKMNGKQDWKITEIKKLMKLFNCDFEYLFATEE